MPSQAVDNPGPSLLGVRAFKHWHLRELVLNARGAAQPPFTHRQTPGTAGDFFPPLAAAPQGTNHANTPYHPFSAEPRKKTFYVLTPRLGGERNPLVSAGHALRSGPLLCLARIGGRGGRVPPPCPVNKGVCGRALHRWPAAAYRILCPGCITKSGMQQLAGSRACNTRSSPPRGN